MNQPDKFIKKLFTIFLKITRRSYANRTDRPTRIHSSPDAQLNFLKRSYFFTKKNIRVSSAINSFLLDWGFSKRPFTHYYILYTIIIIIHGFNRVIFVSCWWWHGGNILIAYMVFWFSGKRKFTKSIKKKLIKPSSNLHFIVFIHSVCLDCAENAWMQSVNCFSPLIFLTVTFMTFNYKLCAVLCRAGLRYTIHDSNEHFIGSEVVP